VTGAAGLPGRPPKKRHANNETVTPRSSAASTSDASSPRAEAHAQSPPRVSRFRADRHTLGNRMHGVASPDLAIPRSPRQFMTHEPQADFWAASGDSSAFFGSPSIDQTPAPVEETPSLAEQLSCPSNLHGLLSADDELNAILHMGGAGGVDPGTVAALEMDLDTLLDQGKDILPLPPPPTYFGVAGSLVSFREEIDQMIALVDAFYSEPGKVLQSCKEESGRDVENPAGLLLMCTKKFIDIIQSLSPSEVQFQTQSEDEVSTEIVLLALSSYLALMRLFDALFHRIHKYLYQVPRETYQSLKVKSVLRIGGFTTLQDMPLKGYAIGILDAIQTQVQTLERCMGIPAEYCLSGEASPAPNATGPGLLHRADRTQLFWTVVAQEDVKSRRGTKSYVESIRASIKESLVFLEGW
jgi:hypothetical protein